MEKGKRACYTHEFTLEVGRGWAEHCGCGSDIGALEPDAAQLGQGAAGWVSEWGGCQASEP